MEMERDSNTLRNAAVFVGLAAAFMLLWLYFSVPINYAQVQPAPLITQPYGNAQVHPAPPIIEPYGLPS